MISIELSEGLEKIGNASFGGCASLTDVTIPTTVRRIHDQTFSRCYSLISIELPEGLEKIGNFSFEDCTSLTSVTIPTTLRRIQYTAFQGCSKLVSIDLPIGLEKIGNTSLEGCESVSSFEYYSLKSVRLSISPTKYYELLCYDEDISDYDEDISDYDEDISEHDENRELVMKGQMSMETLRVFQAAYALVFKSLPLGYLAMFLERCNSQPDAIFYILSRKTHIFKSNDPVQKVNQKENSENPSTCTSSGAARIENQKGNEKKRKLISDFFPSKANEFAANKF